MGIKNNYDLASNPLDRNEIDAARSVHNEERIEVLGIIRGATSAFV